MHECKRSDRARTFRYPATVKEMTLSVVGNLMAPGQLPADDETNRN